MAAFLSYPRAESETVERIATALEGRGVKVWLDRWDLRPGLPWQQAAEAGLRDSEATVVFIGPNGVGQWQEAEVRTALEEHRQRSIPVIPVLLPGLPPGSAEQLLPPFLRQHTWVEFTGSWNDPEALDRLQWGITRVNPALRGNGRPQPASSSSANGDGMAGASTRATQELTAILCSGSVTFFLGRHVYTHHSPPPWEMTRYLLQALQVLQTDSEQVALPTDVAASYYAVDKGDPHLAAQVREWITTRLGRIPALYQGLATLLRALERRPTPRGAQRPLQLIVTTNFDVLLERALLRAGVPFTRLVQHRLKARIEVNEYRHVEVSASGQIRVESPEGRPASAGVDDVDGLDELIRTAGHRTVTPSTAGPVDHANNPLRSLSLSGYRQPILYKFLGSADWPESCTISTDQYFEFASRIFREECVPVSINDALSNTPVLFLGCRILDPDFRLTYHTLLKQYLRDSGHRHYAVRTLSTDFEDQIQRKLWESVKRTALQRYHVEIVDAEPDAFLDAIRDNMALAVGPR